MADQEFTTEELDSEEWRDVPNFVGTYQVSNLGRIRRIKPSSRYPDVPRVRAPGYAGTGYYQIQLCEAGRKQLIYAHRAVMLTFGSSSTNTLDEVNHKDGNKQNNRLENLEWVTHKQNSLHASETGLVRRGERAIKAKLTESQVREIRRLCKEGVGASALGRQFHVKENTVRAIRDGVNWKHLK